RAAHGEVERAAARREAAGDVRQRRLGLRRLELLQEPLGRLVAAALVRAAAAGLRREAPARRGHRRDLLRLAQRQVAGEALGAERAQRLPVLELAAVVGRDGAGELDADRGRVERRPRLRREAEQAELAGAQRRV